MLVVAVCWSKRKKRTKNGSVHRHGERGMLSGDGLELVELDPFGRPGSRSHSNGTDGSDEIEDTLGYLRPRPSMANISMPRVGSDGSCSDAESSSGQYPPNPPERKVSKFMIPRIPSSFEKKTYGEAINNYTKSAQDALNRNAPSRPTGVERVELFDPVSRVYSHTSMNSVDTVNSGYDELTLAIGKEVRPSAAMDLDLTRQPTLSSKAGNKFVIDANDLELADKILGSGHYGEVRQGRVVSKDMQVAVKMLKPGATGDKEVEDLKAEIELLEQITCIGGHDNIIRLVGYIPGTTPTDAPMMVVDFAANGELKKFLTRIRKENQSFDIYHRCEFALEIAEGMAFLSEQKIVHRDLACRNVLLDSEYSCKITDFGLARDVYANPLGPAGTYMANPAVSNPTAWKWTCLEGLTDDCYTTEGDVWSYGVLLSELCTLGKSPYPGETVFRIGFLERLEAGKRMQISTSWPKELADKMPPCWELDPEKRPTFPELAAYFEELLQTLSPGARLPRHSTSSVPRRSTADQPEYTYTVDVNMRRFGSKSTVGSPTELAEAGPVPRDSTDSLRVGYVEVNDARDQRVTAVSVPHDTIDEVSLTDGSGNGDPTYDAFLEPGGLSDAYGGAAVYKVASGRSANSYDTADLRGLPYTVANQQSSTNYDTAVLQAPGATPYNLAATSPDAQLYEAGGLPYAVADQQSPGSTPYDLAATIPNGQPHEMAQVADAGKTPYNIASPNCEGAGPVLVRTSSQAQKKAGLKRVNSTRYSLASRKILDLGSSLEQETDVDGDGDGDFTYKSNPRVARNSSDEMVFVSPEVCDADHQPARTAMVLPLPPLQFQTDTAGAPQSEARAANGQLLYEPPQPSPSQPQTSPHRQTKGSQAPTRKFAPAGFRFCRACVGAWEHGLPLVGRGLW